MDECGFRIGNRAYLVGGFLYAETKRVLTCQDLVYVGLITLIYKRLIYIVNVKGTESLFGRTENMEKHWRILGCDYETSLQLARKYRHIFKSYH